MEMDMTNPAPEYLGRKQSDRYYQIPQWGIKSGIFFDLTPTEMTLYIFFISKQDKQTHETPSYAVCDLAERCAINRKYIRPAILTLAANKLILPTNKGIRVRVIILFDPPPDLHFQQDQRRRANAPAAGEEFLNRLPLKAKVLNRRAPSETGDNLSLIRGHFVSDTATLKDSTGDKLGQLPDWGISNRPVETSGDYEPGIDTEEL